MKNSYSRVRLINQLSFTCEKCNNMVFTEDYIPPAPEKLKFKEFYAACPECGCGCKAEIVLKGRGI